MIEYDSAIFAWWLCSFGLPSCNLVAYQLKRGGNLLHDAVGINCKNGTNTDIKAHVPSILAMGRMLMIMCP